MSLLTILFVVGGIEFVFCPLFLAFIWAAHRQGICLRHSLCSRGMDADL